MDDLNLWVIIAQIINFWVLFFIFKYFLWDKLVALIHERKAKLETLENVDADVQARMQEAEKDAGVILEKAREKALEIEQSSSTLAKKSKEKIIAEAQMQAESIVSWAKADIAKQELSMKNALKAKVVDLSLKLNEKLFTSEKVNKDFMEKEFNSINS